VYYLPSGVGAIFNSGILVIHGPEKCWVYNIPSKLKSWRATDRLIREIAPRMSETASTTYEFGTAKGYAVVALTPSLNSCRWEEIERAGTELKERIVALDRPVFMLDLTQLDFMGSSAVALIVRLWKTTQEGKGNMVVVNTSSMIAEVLEIAGLTRIWNIVETRKEAEGILRGNSFSSASPMARFFLAILGWVTAAGALFFVTAGEKQLLDIDPQTARMLTFTCGGIAAIAGLVAAIRDRQIWRALGVLLVLVAAGVTIAAATQ